VCHIADKIGLEFNPEYKSLIANKVESYDTTKEEDEDMFLTANLKAIGFEDVEEKDFENRTYSHYFLPKE